MTVSGQFSCPPPGSFVAVSGQSSVAADSTAIEGVAAVTLVGSYARGAAGPTSDVDLVVLIDSPETLLESYDWFRLFDPHAALIRTGDFGAIQERRLRLPQGLVVEVGIGRPTWAAVDSVDPGT